MQFSPMTPMSSSPQPMAGHPAAAGAGHHAPPFGMPQYSCPTNGTACPTSGKPHRHAPPPHTVVIVDGFDDVLLSISIFYY